MGPAETEVDDLPLMGAEQTVNALPQAQRQVSEGGEGPVADQDVAAIYELDRDG